MRGVEVKLVSNWIIICSCHVITVLQLKRLTGLDPKSMVCPIRDKTQWCVDQGQS